MADDKKQPQVQPAKYKSLVDGKEFFLIIDGKTHVLKNETHTWSGTAYQMRQQFEKV